MMTVKRINAMSGLRTLGVIIERMTYEDVRATPQNANGFALKLNLSVCYAANFDGCKV